ncbi:MAG: PDZ domain-containing protein [Planctomycetota bacterium]
MHVATAIASLIAGAGIAATPVIVNQQNDTVSSQTETFKVTTDDTNLSIKIADGKTVATLNGEVIDADRVERIVGNDGSVIVIHAEDGSVMHEFSVPSPPTVTGTRSDRVIFLDNDGAMTGVTIGGQAASPSPAPRVQAVPGFRVAATAAPSDLATPRVVTGEPTGRARLGIILAEPNDSVRAVLGLGDKPAVLIEELVSGLPAEKSGLKVYDIIIEVDGTSPVGIETLREIMAGKKPGDKLDVVVMRGGKKTKIRVNELAGSGERTVTRRGTARVRTDREDRSRGSGRRAPEIASPPSPPAPPAARFFAESLRNGVPLDMDWGRIGREARSEALDDIVELLEDAFDERIDRGLRAEIGEALQGLEEELREAFDEQRSRFPAASSWAPFEPGTFGLRLNDEDNVLVLPRSGDTVRKLRIEGLERLEALKGLKELEALKELKELEGFDFDFDFDFEDMEDIEIDIEELKGPMQGLKVFIERLSEQAESQQEMVEEQLEGQLATVEAQLERQLGNVERQVVRQLETVERQVETNIRRQMEQLARQMEQMERQMMRMAERFERIREEAEHDHDDHSH